MAVGGVGAFLLGCPAARAQGADPAVAAELFHQGRDAMSAGNYEVGCAKFAESERLEPRVGTLINLALCEEARGRLATARRYWGLATDLARSTGDARSAYTVEHFDAIDRRVPRLTIRLGPSAPPGTIVRRDDVELGPASLDTPLPVDPGAHAVVASAAHHEGGAVATLTLAEGDSREIAVEPGAPVVAPSVAPAGTVATSPVAEPGLGPWRITALASGAAGVVGLGLGAYFGVRAMNGQSGAPGVCHGDVCDPVGASVRRDAIQSADQSTAAFVVGGALLAAGAVLWFVAPRQVEGASVEVAPGVLDHGGGVRLVARF
jgi:hypothetical protein